MWIYVIILGVIWGGLVIPVVQERRAWIALAHGGNGLFFTSLLLSLGHHETGNIADILWCGVTQFRDDILYPMDRLRHRVLHLHQMAGRQDLALLLRHKLHAELLHKT